VGKEEGMMTGKVLEGHVLFMYVLCMYVTQYHVQLARILSTIAVIGLGYGGCHVRVR
jgi:hypothetical protein